MSQKEEAAAILAEVGGKQLKIGIAVCGPMLLSAAMETLYGSNVSEIGPEETLKNLKIDEEGLLEEIKAKITGLAAKLQKGPEPFTISVDTPEDYLLVEDKHPFDKFINSKKRRK